MQTPAVSSKKGFCEETSQTNKLMICHLLDFLGFGAFLSFVMEPMTCINIVGETVKFFKKEEDKRKWPKE